MFEVAFEGIEEMQRAFEAGEDEALTALVKAVDESGEHLIATAMGLSPKLTGDLEGSGTKDPVVFTGAQVSVEVGFKGLPYIVRRHEEVYSPGTITRGKPAIDGMVPGRKFLEQPLVAYTNRYHEEWAKAVRAALGRSFNV